MYNISYKSKCRFAFFFASSFILYGYSSWIPKISIGTLIFILYSIKSIFTINKINFKRLNFNYSAIIMTLSLIFISILSIIFSNNTYISISSMFFNILKLLIASISVSLVNYLYFDYDIIFKWIIRVAIIATVYLIIQYLAYYFISIRLPNVFNLIVIKPFLASGQVEDIFASVKQFRPGSFFLEPSHYGTYVTCALVIFLFNHNYNDIKLNEIFVALFFTIGIILSTSTSALFIIPIVWFIYLRKTSISNKVKLLIIIIPIFATILMLSISNVNILEILGPVGNSIKTSINKVTNYDNSARIGKSFSYINFLNEIQKFIGIGIGNEDTFFTSIQIYNKVILNSISTLIIWTGYIGLLIYIFFIIKIIKNNKDKCSQTLLLIFIIKGFSSGMFINIFSILYLSIIIYRSKYMPYQQDKSKVQIKKVELI